jgi:hypothetical protein
VEINGNQIFVHNIRIDPVRGLPDPDDAGRSRLENKKIVRKTKKKDAVALASGCRFSTTSVRDGACAFRVKEKG